MTISTTSNQITYVGDAVTLAFAFPYPFITTNDLKVYVNGVQVLTGFSVAGTVPFGGSGTFANGTVTFVAAPAALATVLIYSDPDQLQSTALPPNDPFPSKTVEKMVDKVTLLIQSIYRKFGNALTYPPGDLASGVLPTVSNRASKLVSFDALGNVIAVAPSAGSATALAIQLADTASASNGDAMIGAKRTAIAAIASTVHNWIEGTVISAAEVGITPANSSASNTSILNSLITVSPGRRIYFPGYAGTYQFGDIDLTTGTHYWFGDGVVGTRFQYTGAGLFLNAVKAADAFLPRSPIYIEGISFDGVTKGAKTGISIKNRHDWVLRNCTFDNFSTLIKLDTAYIGELDNVNGTACDIGWDIVGDINRVAFRSCGVTDFATYGVRLKGGVFGNIALTFDNCDLEFAGGVCVRSESDDLVEFNNCYIGDGTTANVFEITTGKIVCRGGLVQWGSQAAFTNRIVEFVGANPTTDERSLTLERVRMAGGTFCGPDAEKMVKGDGKLYALDCGIGTQPAWNGQAKVMLGEPLGKRPGFNALLSPFGRTFTAAKCNNTGVPGTGTITFTSTPDLTTGGLTVACTGAGAATDTLFAYSTLQVGELQTFGAAGMIVVYSSNSTWSANLSSGAFNTVPALSIGAILPSTAGAVSTCVIQGQNPLAAAYTTLELLRTNPANGDNIKIIRVYLFDERQYGAPGTLYAGKNLFEPI